MRLSFQRLSFAMILSLSLWIGSGTNAMANEYNFSLAALGGLSSISKPSRGDLTYGFGFATKAFNNISLSARYLYVPNGGSVNLGGFTSLGDAMHLDATVAYHFTDIVIPGLWVGPRFGLLTANGAQTAEGTDYPVAQNGFEFGPAVGYDHMILENISVGVDIDYLFSAVGVSSGFNYNSLDLLVAVKLYL